MNIFGLLSNKRSKKKRSSGKYERVRTLGLTSSNPNMLNILKAGGEIDIDKFRFIVDDDYIHLYKLNDYEYVLMARYELTVAGLNECFLYIKANK